MPIRRGRSKGKAPGAVPAATLVEGVLKKYGVLTEVREHRIVTGWREIVGERVAARAWPDGLKEGVLYVRVVNSAWLHELSFLREALTDKANAACGKRLVREVRFHLGARSADADDSIATLSRRAFARRPAVKPRKPASPETLRQIDAEMHKVENAELREAIRGLRHKLGL